MKKNHGKLFTKLTACNEKFYCKACLYVYLSAVTLTVLSFFILIRTFFDSFGNPQGNLNNQFCLLVRLTEMVCVFFYGTTSFNYSLQLLLETLYHSHHNHCPPIALCLCLEILGAESSLIVGGRINSCGPVLPL